MRKHALLPQCRTVQDTLLPAALLVHSFTFSNTWWQQQDNIELQSSFWKKKYGTLDANSCHNRFKGPLALNLPLPTITTIFSSPPLIRLTIFSKYCCNLIILATLSRFIRRAFTNAITSSRYESLRLICSKITGNLVVFKLLVLLRRLYSDTAAFLRVHIANRFARWVKPQSWRYSFLPATNVSNPGRPFL